ncbi:hypothetical protein [uncultured Marinobacter sp.]|uniref:hypothetical protein n=1 Tax=uncultured Marinobacter sp. TaxID=187379 RepID=UPI0030D9FEEB|tara:strand:+ start:70 stop:756 length:687 start_codon:yes stop_codon:yes gene_type:complete
MFDRIALNDFYSELSAENGMNAAGFQSRLRTLFSMERSASDLDDYRLGKKPWKKLRDEVTPVSRFIVFNDIDVDRVRFPLNDSIPDCWLMLDNGNSRGIEVTIERGQEQYHLTKEMNECGIGRGFIGMQDDAPKAEFNRRMSKPRVMYSSEQALAATKAGIIRCLTRKNDEKYNGTYYLVIQAHLTTLPKERWGTITEELSDKAASLPFQEVHVIGNADEAPWGFRLK